MDLKQWRAAAEQSEKEAEQGRQELRREERDRERAKRESAERMQRDAEAWNSWFADRLSEHLSPILESRFQGVAEGVGQVVSELRAQLAARELEVKKYLEQNYELRIEVAKLAAAVAELRGGFTSIDTSSNTRARAN